MTNSGSQARCCSTPARVSTPMRCRPEESRTRWTRPGLPHLSSWVEVCLQTEQRSHPHDTPWLAFTPPRHTEVTEHAHAPGDMAVRPGVAWLSELDTVGDPTGTLEATAPIPPLGCVTTWDAEDNGVVESKSTPARACAGRAGGARGANAGTAVAANLRFNAITSSSREEMRVCEREP